MLSRMKGIGVAIVGAGFMGTVHTEALRRVGVTITGILGSTPEKSVAAAERLGLPKGYAAYEDILNDPAVHAIHVNTPNRLHLRMSIDALRAGKHVMCEKPLGMDARESWELVAAAHEHPYLATGVNYNNRFYPLCHEARDTIRRGEAGRLFHVTGSVTQDWLLYNTDYNWRVLREEQGELRALADIGSHWLDLIHFITGLEIEALCADFETVHPVRRRPSSEIETFSNKLATEQNTESVAITTDDYGAVLLRFRGGARGCFFVSQVSPGRKYRVAFEVAGQNRTLAWNSEECENLWVGRRDGPNLALLRDPSLLGETARGISDYPGGHDEGYPDCFKMCFRSFYRYIADGDFSAPKPYPTFEDGHRDNVLCEAFLESKRQGGWVTVEETVMGD
jgi:predicted dehydrogenase